MPNQRFEVMENGKTVTKAMDFADCKNWIAKQVAMNQMQYNKILRCHTSDLLNTWELGYTVRKVIPRKPKIYALYSRDEYICDGTIQEIAEQTGKSVEWLICMKTPGYRERFKDNKERLWLEELEEEE